jgi:hypothetical protein
MAKHSKTSRDPFGLDATMAAAGKKKLAEQPTMKNNVPCEHNVRTNRPSASRNVKGIN